MEDFYRELIIERYKEPHFRGVLDPNDISYDDDNPSCGDHIQIDVRLDEEGIVTEALFSGEGCAISLASADLLLESIIGKSVDDIKEVSKEDILENLGIELGPVRLKCALLPLKVLKSGVYGINKTEESD
jgi:nitrogen fixation NifU-like protein